jgi:hypothetical protein
MYLVYGTDIVGYSSMINSMETTFQIMLGKIDVSRIQQDELVILGPIIFSAYNVAVIFFVLNIFISIITDSFDKVRAEAKLDKERFDFMKYIWNKIKTIYENEKIKNVDIQQNLDQKDFSKSIDNLNSFIFRVII